LPEDRPETQGSWQREWIYRGRIVNLAVDELTGPSAQNIRREIVFHPGAAAILAFDHEGRVLLEKQYRHAAGQELWEIPAGLINPGETPAEAARRELAEETGWQATFVQPCLVFYTSPGFTNERLYLFHTTVGARGPTHFDEDENIRSEFVPGVRLRAMLAAGEIIDAKTLIAIMWAQTHGFLP